MLLFASRQESDLMPSADLGAHRSQTVLTLQQLGDQPVAWAVHGISVP